MQATLGLAARVASTCAPGGRLPLLARRTLNITRVRSAAAACPACHSYVHEKRYAKHFSAASANAPQPSAADVAAGSTAAGPDSPDDGIPGVRSAAPTDLMIAMFTCKVCETRTARTISKNSYTRGTVLVRCPGCRNTHLLADHLGFLDDNSGGCATA